MLRDVLWGTPESTLLVMLLAVMVLSALVGFVFGAAWMEVRQSLGGDDEPTVPKA